MKQISLISLIPGDSWACPKTCILGLILLKISSLRILLPQCSKPFSWVIWFSQTLQISGEFFNWKLKAKSNILWGGICVINISILDGILLHIFVKSNVEINDKKRSYLHNKKLVLKDDPKVKNRLKKENLSYKP